MKIAEYNDMMSYLTRPGFSGGSKKPTIDDLKKSGQIVTGDKYKPKKPKYIKLQEIIDFELRNPRKTKSEGGPLVPEPKPYTLEEFQERADLLIKGALGGFPKDEMINKLQIELDKVQESGTLSKEEAINFINERTQQLREYIKNNPGETLPELDRVNKAIGGGVIQGEDLGTREGFNRPLIPVSELPKKQQTYINNWLKNNPDKKWEDLTNNQRNMLKKGQNVGVGYGATTPKGADNPLFEPLSKKGEEIAKKVYGTTDISKEKRLRINSGEITMDTKPVAFEKGKDISVQSKRDGKVYNVVFPDKKMEKDFIKAVKARVKQPEKSVTEFRNKDFAELFPISEKQAGRAVQYYINKLGLEYAKVKTKTADEIIKNTKNLIKKTSSFLQENRIRSAKTNILQDLDLQKKMDTAHRVSKTHMAKLGLEFNTDIMGIDSRLINQIIVKPSEIQLDRLYRKQYDIFEKLKKNPNSTELKNNLKDINKQVTDIVKNTSGRLVGVTIDPDTLETSFQGIKKKYSFSNVLGDSMTMKELENIPKEDQVKFLTKQLPKAIDLEVKRGFVPNDFKNILSNPDSQKAILNYAKQKAPELIAPLKKAFLNPASKVSLKLFSQFPAITTAGLVGYGGYKVMGFDQEVRADDMSKPIDPGVAVSQEQTDTGIPAEAVAAGSVGAVKYGPQLLKILKNVGKGTIKTLGSLPAAVGYAGLETKAGMDEGKSFTDAVTEPMVGLNLLLPETVKKLGPLMAKGARISTPVGATITGIGTLKNRAQNMIRNAEELAALEATPYQQDLIDEYAAKQYRGFESGGRVNFADGPEDPSKRKFMKIMGGLASLPIVGRFFDVAQTAAPVIEKIKTVNPVGKPEWFDALINKVIQQGTDMTKQFATKEREIVHGTKISDDEYVRVVQDLDDNSVRIEYDSPTNVGQDTVVLEVKPGMMDEATGKKPRDEFVAAETEPRYVGGPEDTDMEFDGENSGPGLMFIESDVSNLKQFATGKKLTKEEAAKAEKRKEYVAKINDDSYEAAQHLAGKYGDGPDLSDYYDDFIDE
jgi:hypothetical protein